MILIDNIDNKESNVLAHAKLSPIPSDAEAAFIETVVVDRRYRGKGLGKFLMIEVENHCFETLNLKTIYLSTIDQEGFYLKLGYNFCKAMNMFGTRSAVNSSTKKIWMMKKYSEWKRPEVDSSENKRSNWYENNKPVSRVDETHAAQNHDFLNSETTYLLDLNDISDCIQNWTTPAMQVW